MKKALWVCVTQFQLQLDSIPGNPTKYVTHQRIFFIGKLKILLLTIGSDFEKNFKKLLTEDWSS